MSTLSMKQLLESGAQFGHQVNKLNRQMRPFIFSESNNIHIIDLKQTIQEMNKACVLVREITSSDGTILFVGRKEKAREIIKAEAVRCEMPYVNEQRNNEDLSDNITLLNEINGLFEHHKKQEKSILSNASSTSNSHTIHENPSSLNIQPMKDIPELIFVVDAYNEASIVDQANYNGIPVIALVNTNSDLTGINIAIPCNDESIRTIQLLVSKIADAVLEGKIPSL